MFPAVVALTPEGEFGVTVKLFGVGVAESFTVIVGLDVPLNGPAATQIVCPVDGVGLRVIEQVVPLFTSTGVTVLWCVNRLLPVIPVPLMVMIAEPLGWTVSVIVTFAVSVPVVVGSNVTLIEQEDPAVSELPQLDDGVRL